MPIDDRTTNRSYQLPNAGNLLVEDVARLRAALQAIDADVFARYTKLEVDQLISNLINGAPGALDTLDELAAALGDDANFAATLTNQLAQKANATAVYTKAESDARYVQGSVQTEMVFTATANQSVFTLSTAIINKPSALVTVDGVVQPTAEYSLNQTGTQLTLSEGVPAGTVVRVLALGVASQGAPADDTVTTPKLRDGAVTLQKLAAALQEMLLPAGAVQFFAGSAAPTGWLKANGATISRTTYPFLWAYAQASGNLAASEGAKAAGQFGPGNGTSTFSLPDYRGEFLRGWDDGRGVDSGRTLGSAQAHAIQSHNHPGVVGVGVNGSVGTTGGIIGVQSDGINTAIGNTGGTETRPRNIALLACIKS
jgi:microcystin-dependent protein